MVWESMFTLSALALRAQNSLIQMIHFYFSILDCTMKALYQMPDDEKPASLKQ